MAYTKAGRLGPKFVDGGGVPGREATVYVAGSTTLATLYTSSSKSVTADNPTVLDAKGLLSFYADPGTYTVKIGGSSTRVQVRPDASEKHSQDVTGVVGDVPYDMDTLAELATALTDAAGTYVTVVEAGSDPDAPRPEGAVVVYWLCDTGVAPANATVGVDLVNAGGVLTVAAAPGGITWFLTRVDEDPDFYWLAYGLDSRTVTAEEEAPSSYSPSPYPTDEVNMEMIVVYLAAPDFVNDGSVDPISSLSLAELTGSDLNHVIAGSGYRLVYQGDSFYGDGLDDEPALLAWLESLDLSTLPPTVPAGWTIEPG